MDLEKVQRSIQNRFSLSLYSVKYGLMNESYSLKKTINVPDWSTRIAKYTISNFKATSEFYDVSDHIKTFKIYQISTFRTEFYKVFHPYPEDAELKNLYAYSTKEIDKWAEEMYELVMRVIRSSKKGILVE